MYTQFLSQGSMSSIFALRRKSGEAIMIRFEAEQIDGRSLATWTHYQPLEQAPERVIAHSAFSEAGPKWLSVFCSEPSSSILKQTSARSICFSRPHSTFPGPISIKL